MLRVRLTNRNGDVVSLAARRVHSAVSVCKGIRVGCNITKGRAIKLSKVTLWTPPTQPLMDLQTHILQLHAAS